MPKSVGISGCSERPGAFFELIFEDGLDFYREKTMKNHHESHFFHISEKIFRIFLTKFESNDLKYPI